MKIIKKPGQINATVVGNPTISNDFIVSNFLGNTNYVYTTTFDLSSSDNWVAQVKVNRHSSSGTLTQTTIRFHDGNDNFMGQLGWSRSQGRWWVWFCSIDNGLNSSFGRDTNTWYWFRLVYSNGYFTVKLSTTGAFEGEEVTMLTTTSVSNYKIIKKIIFGSSLDGEYLSGEIDMKECWLKINDVLVWAGTKNKYYCIKGSDNIIYQPSLDGTEQITVLSGDVSIQNNILRGGSGYLSLGWDNTVSWELTFKFRGVSTVAQGGFYIIAPTMTERDVTEFLYTGDSRIYMYTNRSSNTSGYFMALGNITSWEDIKFTKTGSNGLRLKIRNYETTLNWSALSSLSRVCIGVDSWGGVFEIKDILVTSGDAVTKYYGISSSQYQQLEYIQSTDGQYIDTLFVPNKDTKIEITANLLSRSNSPYLFGAGKGWENSFFAITVNSIQNNGCIFCFNNNSSHRYQFFNINNKYTINLSKDYSQVISNGSTWNGGSYSNYSSFVTTENTLLLFAIHWASESDEPQDFAQMKLYGCKIWNNEILVRDYIPVRRKSDNVVCLFDQITQQYFENLGTGNFIGSDE